MRWVHGCMRGARVAQLPGTAHLHPNRIPCWKGRRVEKIGYTMLNMIRSLRVRLDQHARFRRIRDEIASMPLDVALDLNIYRGDASKIARKAVWG